MAGRPPHGTSPVGVVGERLGQRYELLRPLARGGMAEVWEATDTILGRSVAAKILYPHLASDAGFRARFKREAISAARLNHPAIVTVYDTGIDEYPERTNDAIRAYIIMELVPGRTMRALMSESALSVSDSVSVVAQAADGLAFAHLSGFVHRDVKPGNIMVQPDGRVKVADFGIAKAVQQTLTGPEHEDLTQVGSILGTAKYLSPEQVEGAEIDTRSDIYSLGVVLYEAVCGRPPFVGATDLATATLHVNGTTQRPRQIRPELSRSLERVIMTAMARDPQQRYQRASDLARALRTVDIDDDAAPAVTRAPSATTPPAGTPRPVPAASAVSNDSPDASTVLMDERTRAARRPTDRIADRTSERPALASARETRPATPRSPRRLPVVRLASLAIAGLLVGGAGGWFSGSAAADEIDVQSIRTFDPAPGDGAERNELLSNLTDGTLAAWRTETYDSGFAGVSKRGVGLILDVGSERRIGSLQVASLSAGWNAVVYTDSSVGTDLASWGARVTRFEPVPNSTITIKVNRRARYVMLWVDDLGPNASVSIAEVKVFG
jgi:serine/threonine protein kinase